MHPRFIPAGSPSQAGPSDRRPSRLKTGATAAAVTAIAGVAAVALASPALAATGSIASPSHVAALTSDRTAAPGKPAAVLAAPVLAAPALAGTGPLAVPALGGSAPLAAPGIGGTGRGASPLAATVPAAAASPHPRGTQPGPARPGGAQPSASPTSGGPATPAATTGPGQPAAGSSQPGTAQQAAPQQPYNFYDSVTPSAIPAGQMVATYASGPFAVSPAQVAGRPKVLWIDTNGTDPNADVLDVEPGDATPSMAATWARAKLHANPNSLACIYTMISEWPATQAAIATLPAWMQKHIRWWIADPTGYQHIVPGSDATQWYWGSSYDISTAKTGL